MENSFKASYPKLSRIKHNSYYLGLVQNLFCGKEGKIVSFLQLSYQANVLSVFGNRFSSFFSKLANDELFHIKLLSEAIVALGGDPVLTDNKGLWLSGRWLDYVKDVKQMLWLNIELKQKTIIDYKTTISKIDDVQVKNVLNLILKDEQEMLNALKEELKSIS
ncbi:MAG: ferritin-like domain-containing protein [Christensenellales bacterium]|jgi:bacterioferritin (cytochrome b1)